ncbi:MAG: aldehyde dehydrogenase family protein [Pirellulaceae bacterium]|nr:aldehyde dehydrogenase family protein [Pirellulaceae bacterium]
METLDLLKRLGVPPNYGGSAIGSDWTVNNEGGNSRPKFSVHSPIDGALLAEIEVANKEDLEVVVAESVSAFRQWRTVPAPIRGEFVRRLGEKLRHNKEDLAKVITLEAGKIMQESLGEVQEMIDICEFAVGLSRQLYGLTIASERPNHRLMEQWHPLGPVGVISAFNFPVAVWAWNSALALVCGDSVIWKPSEKTPLCAIVCHALAMEVAAEMAEVPKGVLSYIVGDGPEIGKVLAAHPMVPLVSATGSVPMGRSVAATVASRLGRSLLELGGNNALIVSPHANLDNALRAIVFSAVGTCGQRCTTLRRLIVHDSVADRLLELLCKVYTTLPIGNPSNEATLIGPLIDEQSVQNYEAALEKAKAQGGKVHGGGRLTEKVPKGGYYVKPAIVEISSNAEILQQETFAPIMYFVRYSDLKEAIEIQNNVPQGLSSAIFSDNIQEAEFFLSAAGSDCGIANVNLGTSGAEIGGAFGGEKETGGGRESGSDAWKAYMRRATNTINYGTELPLAQGIKFDF